MKSTHYKILCYIVANELYQKRDPLRETFLVKYGKKYNNIRKHIVFIKKTFGVFCENHLEIVKEKINETKQIVNLTFPYNVTNVLSQFMLANGVLEHIGPIPFVIAIIDISKEIHVDDYT